LPPLGTQHEPPHEPHQERGIFSILAQAAPIYGKNIKFLAVITLLAFVPVFVFRMFLPDEYLSAYLDLSESMRAAITYGVESINFQALVPTAVWQDATTFMLLFFAIELAFFPLSTAAAVYLVGTHLMEDKPTFDGMFNAALPRFPKMLVTTAVFALFAFLFFSFGGFVMLIGLYFIVGMVLYQHVVTDLGRWGPNAISISRHIIRGRWFKAFFFTLVVIILHFALSVIFEMAAAAMGALGNPIMHLPIFLLQHLLLSFFAVAFALWYFDMKRVHQVNLAEIQRRMEILREQMERFRRGEDIDPDEMRGDEEDRNENDDEN